MTRISEIDARLSAASRLPWMKDPDDHDKILHSTNGGFDGYVIATMQKDDFGLFEEANTDLIAHAPDDLATLVAVVKAVLLVHQPYEYTNRAGSHMFCEGCEENSDGEYGTRYPCETVRVITQALEAS